jgi:hypothetical protein
MIEGVPFSIRAKFDYNPGAIVYLQKNVSVTKGGILIPLVLQGVTLSSSSKALNEKKPAILEILKRKYGGHTAKDSNGNRIYISPYGGYFKIFSVSGLNVRLKTAYEQYLTRQAIDQGKAKHNLSDGL